MARVEARGYRCLGRAASLLVTLVPLASCGGVVELDGAIVGAGGGGSGGTPTGGAVTGGTRTGGTATGGVATGGASTGGTRTGGAATGGRASGGVRTGGAATGGARTGGAATGGAATGGMATGGAVTGGAATGGGGGLAGSALAEFCSGGSKVSYQGQTVSPPVTNYESNLVMDCCMAYGVHLHTRASFGFDFEVEIIESTFAPGEYPVSPSSYQVRAAVRTSLEPLPPQTMHQTFGLVRMSRGSLGGGPWDFGLCLEVVDPGSEVDGTRLYVPQVAIPPYSWYDRFGIYLLADASLSAADVLSAELDSLVLAKEPLLRLRDLTFVEQSTHRFGLNQRIVTDDSVLNRLGQVNLGGEPFVVVADAVRIYVGAFVTPISSYAPDCPTVSEENVTPDGFVVDAPLSGPDRRNDPRILQVLSEAGRLVP